MSAPRVLLSGVVLAQPMGGVVRHAREVLPRVARLLTERGGGLCLFEGPRPLDLELPREVERRTTPVPAGPTLLRASLEGTWLRRTLAEAARAGRAFDLVHTAHLPVPRSLPVPFALLLHDLKALHLEHTPMSRRLIARQVIGAAVARAARVLVVSEALRQEVLRVPGADAARVVVVSNAGDHLAVLPREPAGAGPLVHVGHVEPRKNLELVLRALAHDPSLPRLVLAGAPKRDEDVRLRDLAVELGVSARVEFVGLLDDAGLARLYARAGCVVFPSKREGFGIPALEAQRARAPLAVARTPALTEVAGLDTPAFAPDDPGECARAIRSAMASSTDTLEAAAARAQAVTWDAVAERVVEAWSAAAASGARC